ncbi:phage integrase family protein [Burkholderia glumae]|uniref:site-specific integrase n=2 Tax=Burkholderia glumae TaxID=337 RepID=UPI001373F74E|nr:site-specific integrase [Burkholderia glumae]QHP94880.1 integrase [Burkholderia glumae]QKM51798.1 Tyrosine recombinase XerD [Burkholderia glumae]
MTNRIQQLELPEPRTYSRTEFTALRARVKGLPTATIARLYFDPESTPYVDAPHELDAFLRTMRSDLVALAMREGSPVLKQYLQEAIQKYGEPRLTPVSLQMIEQAAGAWAAARPAGTHEIGRWFRPVVAERLAGEGIHTLAELVALCNRRGGSWWRSVPRIGPRRAQVLVAWLRRHAQTIGTRVEADVVLADPLAHPQAAMAPSRAQLVPLERIDTPAALSGERGVNRAGAFSFVHAHHDLDAIRAYLNRYTDSPNTLRVYRRELERLLLWCVVERGTALSSLMVEDCEAYKAFLVSPSSSFCGPRVARTSNRWRPFTGEPMSLESQRYAVRTIRAAFDWLVKVRYLAGNPWSAVTDPKPVKRLSIMRVDRALPLDLWTRMRDELAGQAAIERDDAPRWRVARALLLLLGDSGLRISELASANREQLAWLAGDGEVPATWLLQVIGKGNKERFVALSNECVAALRAHWRDRGADFDADQAAGALVAPLVIPPTPRARAKFESDDTTLQPSGYSVRGATGVLEWAVEMLSRTMADLSEPERRQLAGLSPHALRHTFGTQAVATGMNLDVVQKLLGHASLQTTSVYVTAEQRRQRIEAANFHAALARKR